MRRTLAIAAGLLLAAGGLFALQEFFSGRDDSGIATPAGERPGRAASTFAGYRLTGADGPAPPQRDERRLAPDALIRALALGNVALVYADARPPADLVALRDELAGTYDPAVAAAGQAVLLVRARSGSATGAVARGHLQASSDPQQLRAFADAWLGAAK